MKKDRTLESYMALGADTKAARKALMSLGIKLSTTLTKKKAAPVFAMVDKLDTFKSSWEDAMFSDNPEWCSEHTKEAINVFYGP